MLALWVPSIFFSPVPLRSFEAWARIPIFVGAITLLWAMLSGDRETLQLTFKTLLIASAIVIVFAVVSLALAPDRGTSWIFQLLRNKWYHHRVTEVLKEFSTMATLLVPAVLLAGYRLRGRWLAVAVASVIGILAVVWMTYNRSAMAGLLAMGIVATIAMTILYRRSAVNVGTGVCLVAAMIGFMVWLNESRTFQLGLGNEPPESVTQFAPIWLIDYQRQLIWQRAFEFGMDAPWFGNGINAINLLPGADAKMPGNNLHIIPAHPHNWLVEVFVETGTIGAISLLVLIAYICLKITRHYLSSRDNTMLAALLVNVGYWSTGLLNVSFWSAWWQISYLLLSAICLAACRQRNGD
jgi:O-antigen ligase